MPLDLEKRHIATIGSSHDVALSANALVVISQEPSVCGGLRDSGLQRNYTCRMVMHNHGASAELAKQVT